MELLFGRNDNIITKEFKYIYEGEINDVPGRRKTI